MSGKIAVVTGAVDGICRIYVLDDGDCAQARLYARTRLCSRAPHWRSVTVSVPRPHWSIGASVACYHVAFVPGAVPDGGGIGACVLQTVGSVAAPR